MGSVPSKTWFDYRLEIDPRFLERIEKTRAGIRAGKGIAWDEVGGTGTCEFIASDKPAGRAPRRRTGR